jgi:hypothetical protein
MVNPVRSDLFRSVRCLGFAAARRSHPSGELQGRSSVWLPARPPSAGHRHALVLVTTIGPLPGAVTAPCLAQAPPPNPIAAGPDGRRVHTTTAGFGSGGLSSRRQSDSRTASAGTASTCWSLSPGVRQCPSMTGWAVTHFVTQYDD